LKCNSSLKPAETNVKGSFQKKKKFDQLLKTVHFIRGFWPLKELQTNILKLTISMYFIQSSEKHNKLHN
jgi:hypothetical protein